MRPAVAGQDVLARLQVKADVQAADLARGQDRQQPEHGHQCDPAERSRQGVFVGCRGRRAECIPFRGRRRDASTRPLA